MINHEGDVLHGRVGVIIAVERGASLVLFPDGSNSGTKKTKGKLLRLREGGN